MANRDKFAQAVKVWEILIGQKAVQTDNFKSYQQTTFGVQREILAILHPASTEQVQDCLKVANQYQFPIYPTSRGKNWGFGSRVPVDEKAAVILDLSRLDQIRDFDATLGYVTVGPGVTFRQLHHFLKEQQASLMVSIPGTTPDASVLANVLERGHGSGPYGDRAGSVCALEVVLPTGEVIHTGLSHFADAKAAPIHQWGVGPSLDGLFMQSNLGVVTRMTLWLSPIPPFFQVCYFGLNSDERLTALLDRLQSAKLHGAIRGNVTLWNDYKMLAVAQQYPWKMTETTPLPDTLRERLKQVHEVYRWNGWIGLEAVSAAHLEADRAYLTGQLADHADLLFFADEKDIFPIVGHAGRLGKRSQQFKRGPFWGVPTANTVNSTYWRKKTPHLGSPNLDQDGVGKLTLTAALPFAGQSALALVTALEQAIIGCGFEPQIALIATTERCLDVVIFIIYDRDVAGEDENAMACHHQALALLLEHGIIPTRLGIQSMGLLPDSFDDYAALLQRLKTALDPHHILAPGRYLAPPKS